MCIYSKFLILLLYLKANKTLQKQPPKFRNIQSKTPVPKSLSSQSCNFIKKETLAQVFSCEFRKIFKNSFKDHHLLSPFPFK